MTNVNGIFYPTDGKYLKNIKSGEIYPSYIAPAKSLVESDFTEVSETEFQSYLKEKEEISDSEALEIVTANNT